MAAEFKQFRYAGPLHKEKRGGKRQGAGRPPLAGKGRTMANIRISLEPADIQRLDAEAGKLRMSRSEFVRVVLQAYLILYSLPHMEGIGIPELLKRGG